MLKWYGKKQCTVLFPRTIRRYAVVPTLSSLSEGDVSLQFIAFQTSLEMHQHTTEKPFKYKGLFFVLKFFCLSQFTLQMRDSRCRKMLRMSSVRSSSEFFQFSSTIWKTHENGCYRSKPCIKGSHHHRCLQITKRAHIRGTLWMWRMW